MIGPTFKQIQKIESLILNIGTYSTEEQNKLLSQYVTIKMKQYLFWKTNTYQLIDGKTGINRAKFYLHAFQQNSHSLFYKQLMLYALLASTDGKTLQNQIGHNKELNEYLKKQFYDRCLQAAGGDKIKQREYLDEMNSLIGEIVENANFSKNGNAKKPLTDKINLFESKISSKPNLVENILTRLREMDLDYGDMSTSINRY